MLSSETIVRTSPDIISRESEGELVVVLPKQGKFVVLNATGAQVMALADGTRTLHDIAQAIAQDAAADPTGVMEDVLAFADTLVKRGALVEVEP